MPKSFSEEFKKNIVSSYKRGESISAICKDHNISKTTVYNWVRLYTPNKTKGKLVFTGREVHLLKQVYHTKTIRHLLMSKFIILLTRFNT